MRCLFFFCLTRRAAGVGKRQHLLLFQVKYSATASGTELSNSDVLTSIENVENMLELALNDEKHPYRRAGIETAKQVTLVFVARRGVASTVEAGIRAANPPFRVVVLDEVATKSFFGGLFDCSPLVSVFFFSVTRPAAARSSAWTTRFGRRALRFTTCNCQRRPNVDEANERSQRARARLTEPAVPPEFRTALHVIFNFVLLCWVQT